MERQLFIDGKFSMLYTPKIIRHNIGFIIIPPFAEEKKSSQRVIVNIAQSLSENGYAAIILFDLTGVGDSTFLTERIMTTDQWLKDINSMRDFLTSKSIDKIFFIGIRLGAYLSILHQFEYGHNDKLILISPIFQPIRYIRQYIRKKTIQEILSHNRQKSSSKNIINQLEKGKEYIDIDGNIISYDFFNSLKEFDSKYNTFDLINQHKSCLIINGGNKIQDKIKTNIRLIKVDIPDFWNKISIDSSSLTDTILSII